MSVILSAAKNLFPQMPVKALMQSALDTEKEPVRKVIRKTTGKGEGWRGRYLE